MTTLICVLVYLIIAYFVYAKKIKNWTNHPVWERIYFSLIWVLLIPLYIIHWIHNKL